MYSPLINAEPIPETSKIPFTDEEVNAVWEIKDQDWVDSVLVLLYSGWRISELLSIETANVNLKDWTYQGGTKTRAGKGRIVPIHSKIQSIIENRVKQGNKYLFSYNGKKCTDGQYRSTFWNPIMERLGITHPVAL